VIAFANPPGFSYVEETECWMSLDLQDRQKPSTPNQTGQDWCMRDSIISRQKDSSLRTRLLEARMLKQQNVG
jgi:hypothetical protein